MHGDARSGPIFDHLTTRLLVQLTTLDHLLRKRLRTPREAPTGPWFEWGRGSPRRASVDVVNDQRGVRGLAVLGRYRDAIGSGIGVSGHAAAAR